MQAAAVAKMNPTARFVFTSDGPKAVPGKYKEVEVLPAGGSAIA